MESNLGRILCGFWEQNHLPEESPTNHRLMDALVAVNSGLTKWNAVLSHGMQSQLQIILS
jgi:hypothetical protein